MTYQAPEILEVGNAQDAIQQDKMHVPDAIDPLDGSFTFNVLYDE